MESKTLIFKRKKITEFEELCRRERLPKTIQRRVILEAVLDREDHPTADQLFEDVRSRIPGVSRTTVYRALEALVQLGVVRRANHSDAVARFDGNTDHHHHLVCLGCDRVTDIDGLKLDPHQTPGGATQGVRDRGFLNPLRGLLSGMQAQEDQSAFTPSRLEKREIASALVSLLEKFGSK